MEKAAEFGCHSSPNTSRSSGFAKPDPLAFPVLFSLTYSFHIRQIAQPTRLSLVADQVLGRDDLSRYAFQPNLGAVSPRLLEPNPVNGLQDVDACRWLPYLNHGIRIVAKIGRRQFRNRRSKLRERPIYRLAVRYVSANEQIKILRSPRLGVNTHRIPANHHVLNPVCVERE